ncbi:hypothetical protein EC957_000989 [Mortierella hygrophila]|uniref:Uncharacterized protein n=1 Tax=Mortierella hygrophila TaxID=979708 RepID=A0A9P6F6S8_9FUNG|nr:hypothetical protein EC957_000989 [Mortierella hygrophila]
MKISLITLVGLSTALTYVAAATAAGPAGTGPAQAASTPLTGEQAQAFAMKAAEPFLNLPGLRIQAAATEGIAKAEALLAEYLDNTSNGGGADENEEEGEEGEAAEDMMDGPGKKTGFSAQDVKQFRAAAASAAANQVPLLTLQDGNECSDLCIAGRGELPDAAESETDANDTEDEGDNIEGGGSGEEGDDKAGSDEDGLISRLWKRVVSPPSKASTETETETDNEADDGDSDDADTAPANAADPAAAIVEKKVNMSEDEFLSKIGSCVQSCMLNRAREVTPEDLDDRRAQIEAILRKQEL